MRRRPRPWVCSAPGCIAGALLLRGASGFVPSSALGRVSSSSGGVSASSSFGLHSGKGSLPESFVARGSTRRRKYVGYGKLLRRSGLPAGAAAIVEEEPAGSDETASGANGAEGREGVPNLGGDADESVAHGEDRLQQQGQQAVAISGNAGAGGLMQEQGGDASTSAIAADDSGGSPTSVFTIMSLCFLVAIVCALDRVAMSVAIVPMGNVYDYTDTTKGLISSVFSWGYMASMIPSSVLIGVWGPKATITAGVLVWSAAQMLSPAAAGVSLETLLACRFCMGLGEAVTMPSIQAIVAEWVPKDQRSAWLALIISGLQIGTVLAYWASPFIVDRWDWQTMFLAYGGLGLAWVALWLPLVSDRSPSSSKLAKAARAARAAPALEGIPAAGTPEAPSTPSTAAAAIATATADTAPPGAGRIANGDGGSGGDSSNGAALPLQVETVALDKLSWAGGGGTAAAAPDGSVSGVSGGAGGGRVPREGGVLEGFLAVPWKEYATNGQIWSIAAAHMSHNWGLYVLLAWLPTYFVQEFNLTLGESSGASVVPWVAGAISGNMAGLGADFLVNKGLLDVKSVRKLFQTVALVGPAACMLALAQGPETSAEASRLFTAAVALGSCSCAGFGSSVQDLRSRDTGVIYGMTSACAAVWGSVGTYGAGVILDTTDSWTTVFQSCAAVYMAGALVYATFYKAEPLAVKGRSAVL